MAILEFGGGVTAMRGTVGGVTYSGNGNGAYCKGWSRGPRGGSARQIDCRYRVTSLGAAWRGLTDVERAAWNALTAAPPETVTNSLGVTVALSGFQWFSKMVLRQLVWTSTPTLTWSGVTATPTLTSLYCTYSIGGVCDVGWDPMVVRALGERTVIDAYYGFPGQAVPQENAFRRIYYAPWVAGDSVEVTTEIADVLGVPEAGCTLFVRACVEVASGQRGGWSEAYVGVTV